MPWTPLNDEGPLRCVGQLFHGVDKVAGRTYEAWEVLWGCGQGEDMVGDEDVSMMLEEVRGVA